MPWYSRVSKLAALLALVLVGGTLTTMPSLAAEDMGSLTIGKTVEGKPSVTLKAGDEFVYVVSVGCDDNDCVGAQLIDPLPAELAGFEILRITENPVGTARDLNIVGCTTTVTANCAVEVGFLTVLDEAAGTKGLEAGQSFELIVTLKVPQNLSPAWPSAGAAITNVATISADNAASKTASAQIVVDIPVDIDVDVAKGWSPASQQFLPGVQSTVSLSLGNSSNVAAQALSLQDPKIAVDGAATLDNTNPFAIVDFTGLGTVTAPEGADTVQVDAYVYNAGSWNWVPGTPGPIADAMLPGSAAAASVGGIRLSFSDSASGATIAPKGQAGLVEFTVAQRSTNRTTGDSLVLGSAATNKVEATVTVPGQPELSQDATAPYRIDGLTVEIAAAKTIEPAEIPAGTSAGAIITAKNESNGPLQSLTLSDTDFFTKNLTFGGFTAPINYPLGATGASVTWYYSDNSSQSAPVSNGLTPAAPTAPAAAHLTGFAVTFVGAIPPSTVVPLAFDIDAAPALVPGAIGDTVSLVNTVEVTATNPAGTKKKLASAPLKVFYPEIKLSIDKTISPSLPVRAGGTVFVKLPTSTDGNSAFVKPTEIVVEDSWRNTNDADFWNGFSVTAIAPTQVLAGSILTISYQKANGSWVDFTTVDATAATQLYSGAISIPGVNNSDIVGLRYTFANPTGFAKGTTVSPNTVFEARATKRSGGSTSVADDPASVYENRGVATGSGVVKGLVDPIESVEVEAFAEAAIDSAAGAGQLLASKKWLGQKPITSQSGLEHTTELGWGVTATGHTRVVISDPSSGSETTPGTTVFQNFDLKRISGVTFAQDPLLRWDIISAIELFNGSTWVTVPAPGTSWMDSSGFKGYELDDDEVATTTGVRFFVVPNDGSRAASSAEDTPAVGSGVATSASKGYRPLSLVWELRNKTRVGSQWITSTTFPSIRNTMSVESGGATTGASDTTTLIDHLPAVDVVKTTSKATMTIPFNGDVAEADYPTSSFTVTAKSQSLSRASYVRVTDPMPCTDSTTTACTSDAASWASNPFTGAIYSAATNSFERLNLTKIAFTVPPGEVDKNTSLVTLWKRSVSGALTTEVISATAAEARTASQFVDVVGVSVVYQGSNPVLDGGSIRTGSALTMVLSTQLRLHERSNSETLVAPFTIKNFAFAQSYDPVLKASGAGSTPNDNDEASFALISGVLDVTASKQFTPSAGLLLKDRNNPVSVTLGASDGVATLAAHRVVIEDTDADFWDSFDLTGLGAVALPSGSDQVRVDVQLDGGSAWTLGSFAATAALPAVDATKITGIRFTFDRADARVFSNTTLPGDWTASAVLNLKLRDTLRASGDAVPFPSVIDNTVSVTASRTDGIAEAKTKTASDDFPLTLGTFRLDVSKSPQGNTHTVAASETVPWTLKFSNSGTGFLTIEDLVDTLPSHLSFDFGNPVYSTSAGGLLSTDVNYGYDPVSKKITFSWPAGANRMAPGETFTIVLGLILEPGLIVTDRATNQMVVTTAQTLGACLNTSGNGQGVLADVAATQCGTTNFVQPTPGSSLAAYKGVKGDINGTLTSGATNTNKPGGPCVTDDEGYFRSPCAANSVIGGTDEWKLLVVNSGTENYRSLVMVDPLPAVGDRLLAGGSNRGSTFSPVFNGDLTVTGEPAGSTVSWQVTTSAAPCVGTGSSQWETNPSCTGSTWVDGASYTGDWADATAIRIQFDFSTSVGGVLPPAGAVKVVYHSTNEVRSAALPGGAPATASPTKEFAWNQFGAQAIMVSGEKKQRAPVKVGVTLVEGPLQVSKTTSGAAVGYAPTSFQADVACTIAGENIEMGTSAILSLTAANGYTARVDTIPLGAECTVSERGALGAFGESTRSASPAPFTVLETATSVGAVPATQAVTLNNDYAYGSLSVTKAVDTAATVGDFGTFSYTLECVTLLGTPVTLAVADRDFTLADGDIHTVTANTLPLGASCTLIETESNGADEIVIGGAGITDLGAGEATIVVAAASAATVTNTFEAGTLSVLKTLAGAGAADFGEGPFTASVSCIYGTQTLYSTTTLALTAGTAVLVGEVFPVGTVCSVAEVLTGGASSTDNPPAVVITGPSGTDTIGAVTADITNHFFVGELVITKERVGDGVASYGAGPFEVTVTCTWVRNGTTLTVPLANGGVLYLDDANGYALTVGGIIVGAECSVEETDKGLATASSMNPVDGTVTILDPLVAVASAEVVITNQFDVGQLKLSKTVAFPVLNQADRVVYTITVTNTGQITARNVEVSDLLPAAATVLSTAPTATVAGRTLSWIVDELAVGDSAEYLVTVRYTEGGVQVNRAAIVNPGGPWDDPEIDGKCDDADEACASIIVLPTLPFTGGELPGGLVLFGGAALLLGGALLIIRRRQRV